MDATSFRDSTEIRLPAETVASLRSELEERFVLTIREETETVRLIGSPSEIKNVSEFLTRNGVPVA